ncbi:MAG TPA: hypothetical protein PKE04_01205, partial [Clostridia bacterium]|nr:hypothetical protein [Clostridia bacterium]
MRNGEVPFFSAHGLRSFRSVMVSYLCVFLLPTLLVILLVQVMFFDGLSANVLNASLVEVASLESDVDKQLQQLRSIANVIHEDSEILNTYSPGRPQEVLQLRMRLRMLQLNHDFIDEILLYCNGDEYMFSTVSSYNFESFLMLNSVVETPSAPALYDLVNTVTTNRMLKAVKQGGDRQNLYVYPIGIGRQKKVVLYRIPESAYHKRMGLLLNANTGCVIITDNQGNLISEYSNDSDMDIPEYRQIALDAAASGGSRFSTTIRYDRAKYLCASVVSQTSGLRYSVVLAAGTVMDKLANFRRMWIVIVCVSLLFGIIAAVILSRLNYQPVRDLRQKARLAATRADNRSDNDFAFICDSIDALYDQNLYLQSNLSDVSDYLVFKLFSGQIKNLEEVGQINRIFGLSLYNTSFQAGVLAFSSAITVSAALSPSGPYGTKYLIFVRVMSASG